MSSDCLSPACCRCCGGELYLFICYPEAARTPESGHTRGQGSFCLGLVCSSACSPPRRASCARTLGRWLPVPGGRQHILPWRGAESCRIHRLAAGCMPPHLCELPCGVFLGFGGIAVGDGPPQCGFAALSLSEFAAGQAGESVLGDALINRVSIPHSGKNHNASRR